ncbi:MAG: hypothetical protein GY714_32285 [Desulfobacterales bacterium]|nr:hypothetical protein [Desulfobacterales bacterium]
MNSKEFKQKGLLNQLNMMLFHPCGIAIKLSDNSFQVVWFDKQAPNGIDMESPKAIEKMLYATTLLCTFINLIKENQLEDKTKEIVCRIPGGINPEKILREIISYYIIQQ